jgi:hypothetical protein
MGAALAMDAAEDIAISLKESLNAIQERIHGLECEQE